MLTREITLEKEKFMVLFIFSSKNYLSKPSVTRRKSIVALNIISKYSMPFCLISEIIHPR